MPSRRSLRAPRTIATAAITVALGLGLSACDPTLTESTAQPGLPVLPTNPTTKAPTTKAPATTAAPTTKAPTTTKPPTTAAPTTKPPTTAAPTTATPTTTAAPAEVAGARYVATNGSDSNTGTKSAPFRTITKAITSLKPGDTLYVRGGTYHERVRNPSIRPATSGSPITVAALPGERPVISGLLWLKNPSHWTISGINVTWSSANSSNEHMVKFTDGTGWRFTGAEVWGARSFAGILVAGSPANWRMDRLHVHDTHATNNVNQDHLIYVNTGMGAGVIERSTLTGSPNGRAIKIGPGSPSTTPGGNVTIRYNTMVDNQGPSNVQLSYGASGNKIYRNIMVRPGANRQTVTAYELNGTGNVACDNIGWEARSVLESDPRLADRGGNVMADPQFVDLSTGNVSTKNLAVAAYGARGQGSQTSCG